MRVSKEYKLGVLRNYFPHNSVAAESLNADLNGIIIIIMFICSYTVRVTIFSTGGKCQPVSILN